MTKSEWAVLIILNTITAVACVASILIKLLA